MVGMVVFDFWRDIFDTSDFPQRWYCGNWTASHGWLHIISDIAIWGAYMAIPATLAYWVLRRREVPFLPIFWLFAAFIFSCGTTHLIEAGIFWWPAYRLSGAAKLVTAVVSWATVLALIPVLPKALALPRLSVINDELNRALEASNKSEERLRHVIEAAPNGMVMVDTEGKIVLANTVCAEIFGYENGELIGRSIEDLVPRRHRDKHPNLRAAFLERPEVRLMGHGRDLYGLRKDGTEVPVEIGLNPIGSDEGTMVLASIVDITERKRTEDTVARYMAELERSNRELDEFAYVASHDLRTPLDGIESLATWIEEDATELLPDPSRRHLQQIQQRASRLKKLLDDLLEYSRAGRCEMSFQRVDTRALVEDVVGVLQPPPDFRIEISPDLPTIRGVETPLRHIFHNLIGNAIKHHDRGDGRVQIAFDMSDTCYTFDVSDDGPGIDPVYHERIFRMFETLKPRDQVEGSGMGLAIVKKMLETYGGSIIVISPPEGGTTFRFTWPRIAEPAPPGSV